MLDGERLEYSRIGDPSYNSIREPDETWLGREPVQRNLDDLSVAREVVVNRYRQPYVVPGYRLLKTALVIEIANERGTVVEKVQENANDITTLFKNAKNVFKTLGRKEGIQYFLEDAKMKYWRGYGFRMHAERRTMYQEITGWKDVPRLAWGERFLIGGELSFPEDARGRLSYAPDR
ncbi:MAG: hypothetical protein Q8R53_05145 [Nanoarchaeota archaeon]|nr:hypothetical protein [Nanoarchaeota archaeon]